MGSSSIRVNTMLSFDEEQEKDIIQVVDGLVSSHRIGQFMSVLIRMAVDNPEILEKGNDKFAEGTLAAQIEKTGLSASRYNFFKAASKEVDDMKAKVDKIYDMVLKTYELALMGKYLGLEEKSKNEILANFVIQKQLKELQDTLGIQLTSSVFASNKAADTEKLAEDMLEYIISSYDNIISQLKENLTVQPVVMQQSVQQIPVQSNSISNVANSNAETHVKVENNNTAEEDNEVIDFGSEDLSALANFFGDQ